MKLKTMVLVLLAGAAFTAVAQEYPEFVATMKATAGAMDAWRKAEKKTGPQAVRIAERLGGAYEQMLPFWRQRNAADAVKMTEAGKAAAAEMAAAANAGDAEKAEEAFKTIGGTCKSCHEAHREKSEDGKYRIK
jgi:cytochrome c556